MDASFWQARWSAGQIGFHEGHPNALLARFAGHLGAARRVLVPLCGKAVDLAYLAGLGHQVVGVELVESAAQAFFAEHDVTPQREPLADATRYHHGAITIVVGDMLTVDAAHLGRLDAYYDRAALIALPPTVRAAYVARVRALVPPGSPGLLVTLDYPAGAMDGPPFAVGDAEIHTLYAGAELTRLADDEEHQPRLAAAGHVARQRCDALRL